MSRTDDPDVPLDASPETGENSPVAFLPAFDGDGLAVVDAVERHRYTLSVDRAGATEPADPDSLLFPVDAAVRLRTDHVAVSDVPSLFVRDADGGMLASTEPPAERTFPAGEYYLEICAPVKLYVRVDGPLTVTATTDGKRVDLDGERPVVVGARSKHERPAGTVTTTAAPTDVMAAVSTFGSALKTASPERSFPTLRGHPPAIELGDELSVPDGLEAPDTGVTIEVPPELRYVYPVAPLAHYLGAEVTPGDTPRLVTDAGVAYDLAPGGDFEREVERLLKDVFLLDCITRTEGLYDVALHERRALEPHLDLDFATLYDQPLADRLETYLTVDHDTLAPQTPDWQLTADVAPEAEAVETLPFLVDDLAVIRTGTAGSVDETPVVDAERLEQEAVFEDFMRSSAATGAPSTVDLADTSSMEHAWVGDGAPRGASKATAAAYRNRLDRSPVDGDIEVTVVCNDPAMVDERDVVDEVYGSRGAAAVDVTVREGLTTDELRATLESDAEFLHYVGHIDERGFECVDGAFDAATLDATGIDAFLLNACTSYEQGLALVEAGAVGGVVTLADVLNGSAVRVGAAAARLLNDGYPLRPALDVARAAGHVGGDYIVVGDGSVAVAHRPSQSLHLHRLERDGDGFELEVVSYSSVTGGMGSIFTPYVGASEEYYVDSGRIDTFHLDEAELLEFVGLGDVPIEVGGDIYWPDELELADV